MSSQCNSLPCACTADEKPPAQTSDLASAVFVFVFVVIGIIFRIARDSSGILSWPQLSSELHGLPQLTAGKCTLGQSHLFEDVVQLSDRLTFFASDTSHPHTGTFYALSDRSAILTLWQ